MASKYFNNDRDKIPKRQFEELLKRGTDYSIRRSASFRNRKGDLIRLSIHWCGEFYVGVPDYYCNTHVVRIENFVNNMWIFEPEDAQSSFISEHLADMEFEKRRNIIISKTRIDDIAELDVIVNISKTKEVETKIEINLEDFGEPKVSKNLPKTKNKNMGKW